MDGSLAPQIKRLLVAPACAWERLGQGDREMLPTSGSSISKGQRGHRHLEIAGE
jgi:hypothetical protein